VLVGVGTMRQVNGAEIGRRLDIIVFTIRETIRA
jgi:hypothetical protein